MKRVTVEDLDQVSDFDDLCLIARRLGYRGVADQLLIGNGAAVSDLIEFFEDNEGAVQAVVEWLLTEGCHRDGGPIDVGSDESEDQ